MCIFVACVRLSGMSSSHLFWWLLWRHRIKWDNIFTFLFHRTIWGKNNNKAYDFFSKLFNRTKYNLFCVDIHTFQQLSNCPLECSKILQSILNIQEHLQLITNLFIYVFLLGTIYLCIKINLKLIQQFRRQSVTDRVSFVFIILVWMCTIHCIARQIK